jgi:hypothetical protein
MLAAVGRNGLNGQPLFASDQPNYGLDICDEY